MYVEVYMKAQKKKVQAKGDLAHKKANDQIKRLGKDLKFFFISIGGHTFKAPASKLKEVLRAAEGKLIELPPKKDEDLTTQEVADLLNVSRPYVVNLIDEEKLKGFKVGTQRRVKKADALEFKARMRQEQNNAMDELSAESQKLELEF